jgi:hypothetical protein
MAKVKVKLNGPAKNGQMVSFKAPCNCSEVDGLRTSYLEYDGNEYKEITSAYTFRDATGNDLTNIGPLFSEGAIVCATLDTENLDAYLLNASTNGSIWDILNNQIVTIDNAFTTDSAYVEIAFQLLKYNKLTGAVHGDIVFNVIKAMSDGVAYNMATVDVKYAPPIKVAAAFSLGSDDVYMSGRIQEITHEGSPGRLISRTHMAVSKDNTVYVSFDYYINPGIV